MLPGHEQVGSSTIVREPILATEDGLDDALGSLADHHREWAPVVSGGRLVGILSVRDAMSAYRTALDGNIRQVRGIRAGGSIIEARLGERSRLAGRRIADVEWPREAVLVAIERNEQVLAPRGDVQLLAGDQLSVFTTPGARADTLRFLEPAGGPAGGSNVVGRGPLANGPSASAAPRIP